MIFSGCQSKAKEVTIEERICPQCGNVIEKCGFVAYNDKLSCVQWCKFARQCIGDQMYEKMMETAAHQKAARSS